MTREQETVLRDLGFKLIDQILREVGDLKSLCSAMQIPDDESLEAAINILFLVTIELTHHANPKLTPERFFSIARTHYAHYLDQRKEIRHEYRGTAY